MIVAASLEAAIVDRVHGEGSKCKGLVRATWNDLVSSPKTW
jgi:hypothetical protein